MGLWEQARGRSLSDLRRSPARNLVFGPKENEPQNIFGGGLLEALAGSGFEGLENARRLGEWIEHGVNKENTPFLVDLEPPWLARTPGPIQLELAKTSVEAFWIITSVPRSQIPKYVPPPRQNEEVLLTTLKAQPSPPLETQPLPPLPEWADAPADTATAAQGKSLHERQPADKEPKLQWLTAGTKVCTICWKTFKARSSPLHVDEGLYKELPLGASFPRAHGTLAPGLKECPKRCSGRALPCVLWITVSRHFVSLIRASS